MPRRQEFDDDWNDDSYSDDECENDDDEEVAGTDDAKETAPCPYCKREIHKESERCPHCERYLSKEDIPPSRKPWWLIIGVVACLIVVYLWITRR